jgi:hypothetical protein
VPTIATGSARAGARAGKRKSRNGLKRFANTPSCEKVQGAPSRARLNDLFDLAICEGAEDALTIHAATGGAYIDGHAKDHEAPEVRHPLRIDSEGSLPSKPRRRPQGRRRFSFRN